LKDDLGASDFDTVSAVLYRAAEAKRGAQADQAVGLASTAAELAPSLPYAHLALAEAYFAQDWSGVTRYVPEVQRGLDQLWQNPRFRRATLGDLGAAALFAWFASAVAVVAVLAVRRLRYFLHDVHHVFFPKAVARWQSAALVLLALALPLVFRQGIVLELM